MISVLHLLQEVAQTAQAGAAGPGAPPSGGEHGFSFRDALFELIQFVGGFYQLAQLASDSVSCGGCVGCPTMRVG